MDSTLIRRAGLDEIYLFSYPLLGIKHPDTGIYVPSTLPRSWYDESEGRYSDSIFPALYDSLLQSSLDNYLYYDFRDFIFSMKLGDTISKKTGKPFVNMVQTHFFYSEGTPPYIQREPTNEEIEMMTNVSLTYGARAQFYFWWGSYGNFGGNAGRGLAGFDNLPRDSNVYNQQTLLSNSKISKVAKINNTLNKWEPYLMSFDNQNRHSYIYRFSNERDALLRNTYFKDIVTYKPGLDPTNCQEQSPTPGPDPPNMIYECSDDRYIQVAVFKNPNDSNHYFMIVNRRCSPYINEDNENNRGGKRFIRFYYDANATEFEGYDWWKVTLLGSDDLEEIEFDKRIWGYIDLGYFMPAEGRLYKISPAY